MPYAVPVPRSGDVDHFDVPQEEASMFAQAPWLQLPWAPSQETPLYVGGSGGQQQTEPPASDTTTTVLALGAVALAAAFFIYMQTK